MYLKKIFLLFIVFSSYSFANEDFYQENEQRIKNIVHQSQKTRDNLTNDSNTKRNPASLKSNIEEFERLMQNDTEKDWMNEVDQLSVE